MALAVKPPSGCNFNLNLNVKHCIQAASLSTSQKRPGCSA